MIETENEEYLQFVYRQKKPSKMKMNFVFIWDLDSNQEL